MHSSTCITPLVGGGPRHTPSFRKLRIRVRMTSNMERPQQRRSLVSRSPSRAMAICWKDATFYPYWLLFKMQIMQSGAEFTWGVPNLSIRGTRCRGAYFASSRFILTSSRSPSKQQADTNEQIRLLCFHWPWISASSVFPKYLLYKPWAECSGMGQHEASHTPPPGTKIQAQHQN